MDQDTSNSPGKARWRERLGMGNSGKDMPKISDEFKPASASPKSPPPRDSRLPPATIHGHQPVTRPAPMAPRAPSQAGGGRPVAPVPQGATGLGDRLRAERQAAERLAEQRVAQARGKGLDRPAPPPPLQPPPLSRKPAAPERPKFSFSPEELAKDKRETAPPPEREFPSFSSGKSGAGGAPPPPLTPPRPALGANTGAQQRQQPSQAAKPPVNNPPPPAGAGFQPRYNGPPQPPTGGNYRSLDPPPGGFTPKPAPKPYADTAAYREDPLATRRPAPPVNREYDSYRRGPALPPQQQTYGDEVEGPSFTDYRRRQQQQVPARARQPAYDEDVNEVFEDEEPPRPQRRRASAQDYNRAYRDYEDGYDTDAPRRRGPWPWLLAIFFGGLIIAGGIIYYYLNHYRQSGQATGNVPTIEAPETGAKSAPEPSSGSTLGTQGAPQPGAADTRKQIYDRILGDDEVNSGNQVVPTQEQPQLVEPTGSNEGQGAAPIPDQNSGTQDNNANEPLPLPLPPPGATDQQGSLPSNANEQTAALGAVNKSTAPQPVPEPTSTNTSDAGAPVPGQLAKATQEIAAAPPPAVEQVVSEPDPVPVKPKLKAEKKPIKKVAAVEDPAADQATDQNGGVEPLVLVPPAQSANTEQALAQPDAAPQKPESAATEQKSKSFFNFGSNTGKRKLTGKAAETAQARGAGNPGSWANAPDPDSAAAADSEPQQQQIASVAPEPEPIPAPEPQQPAPQATKPSGSGFVAQLASFRSEAEAMAEYDRLRAKHGNVLNGLSPRVVKANVAGSPRYRLGVGPLASRTAASKICNSLIAAGERDCLVRGN